MKNQKMYRLLLLLLLISSISFSQNKFNDKGERSGIWRGYHDNGAIKYEGKFINGKEIGLFEYYDYSGNLVIRLDYLEPGLRSKAEVYYSSGFIKSRGEYVNKEKKGLWIYYNLDGKRIAEENFDSNNLNGECKYFYDNGRLSEKYIYLHNKKEGEAEIYYPSGYLNMKCNYHLDKLHGVAEFYYDKTNQLESQGLYTLGLQDSIWVFYNELGDTLDLYDYINRRSLMIE
ncbi:MAG: hypothetical protein CMP50_05930 [Flavobacteriales bacterium]|nr:hypothetical protein [Flavobacteriales bacterium]|tara:strand:+ start:248 stop:937 length:690 start_codon:yes stop_codon:yes gene_type:complete